MLEVAVSVEVARELLHPAVDEDVVHEARHELLVGLGLVEVVGPGGAVEHRVAARVGAGWLLLEVVPVLHDLPVLEAEDVETNLGSEEVVVGVGEDEIAVLEHPRGVHPGRVLGECPQERAEAGEAVRGPQVVLDIFVRVDDGDGRPLPGFDRLEEVDHLLLLILLRAAGQGRAFGALGGDG
ncbi:hypothetical protein ACN28S_05315 [Cystobacter fuscus]